MIKQIEIQLKGKVVIALEYYLYAFTTSKGTFTLSGSNANGTDEWKHLETLTFHTWERRQVYEWFIQGKVSAVIESTTLDWYNNPTNKNNLLQNLKSSRKK